ncbi:MAG: hypothetical protein RLZZ347_44 [Candidatus Parcubacteria bacterium]
MKATEMKTRILLFESIPCWYQLAFRNVDAVLIVRIHEVYLAGLTDIPENAPVVRYFERLRGFEPGLFFDRFRGAFQGDTFGFNRALIKQPRRNGDPFVEYWAKIPTVCFETHEVCRDCSGTKRRFCDKCYACRGSGKQRDYDFTDAFVLQTSLALLLSLLSVPPQIDLDTDGWQTLSVECGAESGNSKSGVWGEMGPPLVDHLKGLSKSSRDALITEVSQAMMIAHATMMHESSDPHAFHKSLDDRGIHISCPGNATGIDGAFEPNHSGPYGMRFSPHNVDSPIQGLSLIAGIAKLSELTQFWLKREVPAKK